MLFVYSADSPVLVLLFSKKLNKQKCHVLNSTEHQPLAENYAKKKC